MSRTFIKKDKNKLVKSSNNNKLVKFLRGQPSNKNKFFKFLKEDNVWDKNLIQTLIKDNINPNYLKYLYNFIITFN